MRLWWHLRWRRATKKDAVKRALLLLYCDTVSPRQPCGMGDDDDGDDGDH